jgi:hypothetical protein
MAARKTIAVADVRDFVNHVLATDAPLYRPEDYTPEQAWRAGVIAALEHVLLATDNYRGYGFQRSELEPESAILRDGHDDTRRVYSR